MPFGGGTDSDVSGLRAEGTAVIDPVATFRLPLMNHFVKQRVGHLVPAIGAEIAQGALRVVPVNNVTPTRRRIVAVRRAMSGPATARIQGFLDVLHRHGCNATLRDTRGRDIDAACGQLRVQAGG